MPDWRRKSEDIITFERARVHISMNGGSAWLPSSKCHTGGEGCVVDEGGVVGEGGVLGEEGDTAATLESVALHHCVFDLTKHWWWWGGVNSRHVPLPSRTILTKSETAY